MIKILITLKENSEKEIFYEKYRSINKKYELHVEIKYVQEKKIFSTVHLPSL